MQNMYTEKFFKKLYKTIKESTSSNVAELFYSMSTQTALKRHLGTQRVIPQGQSKNTPTALGNSRHSRIQAFDALGHPNGTWSLKYLQQLRHSGTRKEPGHSGTQGTQALGYWDTRRALGHSGT